MVKHYFLKAAPALLLSASYGLTAQSTPAPAADFSRHEVVVAKYAHSDVGPPFQLYSLYRFLPAESETDVEKITIIPGFGLCAQPTIHVARAQLQQSLDQLFEGKDPCAIPEDELSREVKSCDHCEFSGVHIQARLACNGKPRDIRFEILDSDLFGVELGASQQITDAYKFAAKLDQALPGRSNRSGPIFCSGRRRARRTMLNRTKCCKGSHPANSTTCFPNPSQSYIRILRALRKFRISLSIQAHHLSRSHPQCLFIRPLLGGRMSAAKCRSCSKSGLREM